MEAFSTWKRAIEPLLEKVPGVLSASLEGDVDGATEIRLLVDGDRRVPETLESARAALAEDASRYAEGACFRIQIASAQGQTTERGTFDAPAGDFRDERGRNCLRLITHQVHEVSPGIIGVEVTLGLGDRRFAGAASGQATPRGRTRVLALATLRGLTSYVQSLSQGFIAPSFELESVSESSLNGSRVAVVVVTMAGHAAPLIASWPLLDASDTAVILSTLEAAARPISRWSIRREPAGIAGLPSSFPQHEAESLLESVGAIVSACLVPDDASGFRIHVLATEEMPRGEVLQTVTTLLKKGFDLPVHSDQITVAQSCLPREELNRLLHPTSSSMPLVDEGTLSLDSRDVSRITLVDFYIVAKEGGKQEVGVRLAGSPSLMASQGECLGRGEARAGGVVLLQSLASATLDATCQLMRRSGTRMTMELKAVHRFRMHCGDGVVLLVEATVDDRKTLLSGAAFAADSFERASIVAALQATRALVAGEVEIPRADDKPLVAREGGSAGTVSRASQPGSRQGDPAARTERTERPSNPPKKADPRVPDDYVSGVLARIASTQELDRAPPPS